MKSKYLWVHVFIHYLAFILLNIYYSPFLVDLIFINREEFNKQASILLTEDHKKDSPNNTNRVVI